MEKVETIKVDNMLPQSRTMRRNHDMVVEPIMEKVELLPQSRTCMEVVARVAKANHHEHVPNVIPTAVAASYFRPQSRLLITNRF